jgi:hypothetical protein
MNNQGGVTLKSTVDDYTVVYTDPRSHQAILPESPGPVYPLVNELLVRLPPRSYLVYSFQVAVTPIRGTQPSLIT